MTDRLELPLRYRRELEALLREHVPDAEVWAYGSRVSGESHPASDLDLVLRGPDLEPLGHGFAGLLEALEESNIPILIQAHDWARLPQSFHREIERDYVVVQEGAEPTARREWCQTTLGTVTDFISGGTPSKSRSDYWGGSIPWVSAKDMKRFKLHETTDKVTTVGAANGTRMVPANTVMILVRGMTLLKDVPVCIVQRSMTFNQDVKALVPKSGVTEEFLPYLVLGNKHRLLGLVDLAGHGTGRLNTEEVKALDVDLPPVPEQRAIAHVLGTLDDKIELNRRMNETLEEMARALFQSWFVDFDPVRAKMEGRDTGLPPDIADLFPDRLVPSQLGEIPEGWVVVSLSDTMEINPKRALQKGAIAPYLNMANMPTKGHTPDVVVDRAFGSGMRFTNGDTLVARITPCLENGKTAFVDFLGDGEIGWGSTEYVVLRPKPPLPGEFAYCLARSTTFREFAIQNMTGTSGRQRVAATAISDYQITMPNGVAVMHVFGEVVEPLFSFASQNAKESRALAAQRDALLPKLMLGEVRVRKVKKKVGPPHK